MIIVSIASKYLILNVFSKNLCLFVCKSLLLNIEFNILLALPYWR